MVCHNKDDLILTLLVLLLAVDPNIMTKSLRQNTSRQTVSTKIEFILHQIYIDSSTGQPLHTLNLVELFDLILLTRCTHSPTIFLWLDLFLFSARYLGHDKFLLPSSVILFFHFLFSCIFSIIAVVIHSFLVTFPFKYPTFPSALFITTPVRTHYDL